MKIKHLFCGHIWKLDKEEKLYYVTRKYIAGREWVVVALYFSCIKCGKTKIEEKEHRYA